MSNCRYVTYIFLFSILIIFMGCGDGDYHIHDDYYFTNSGGSNRYIFTKNPRIENRVVISKRVDKYIVKNEMIYVARRVVKIIETDDSIRYALSNKCEYFVIDTILDKVHKDKTLPRKFDNLKCSFD